MIVRMTAVFFGTVVAGVFMVFANRGGLEPDLEESVRMVQPSLRDCASEFLFPAGTRMLFDRPVVNGWRQSGIIPLPFEAARRAVYDELFDKGFALMHEAGDSQPLAKCVIEEWRDANDRKVLWMFWRKTEFETGFSWGEEK